MKSRSRFDLQTAASQNRQQASSSFAAEMFFISNNNGKQKEKKIPSLHVQVVISPQSHHSSGARAVRRLQREAVAKNEMESNENKCTLMTE